MTEPAERSAYALTDLEISLIRQDLRAGLAVARSAAARRGYVIDARILAAREAAGNAKSPPQLNETGQ